MSSSETVRRKCNTVKERRHAEKAGTVRGAGVQKSAGVANENLLGYGTSARRITRLAN